MIELSDNMRSGLLGVLELLSDRQQQLKYQSQVPYIKVSGELFNQWEDVYYPDDLSFKSAFTESELEALAVFNIVFDEVCAETPRTLPPLAEFVDTGPWRRLVDGARGALSQMRR